METVDEQVCDDGKSPESIFHKIRSCPFIEGTVFLTFQYLSGGAGEILPDISDITADIARHGWVGVKTICHLILLQLPPAPGPGTEQHPDNLNKCKRRFIAIICGGLKNILLWKRFRFWSNCKP